MNTLSPLSPSRYERLSSELEKARERAERSKDAEGLESLALSLLSFGDHLLEMKAPSDALIHYHEALKVSRALQALSDEPTARLLTPRAIIRLAELMDSPSPQDPARLYLNAESLARELRDAPNAGALDLLKRALIGLGRQALKDSEPTAALTRFQELLELQEELLARDQTAENIQELVSILRAVKFCQRQTSGLGAQEPPPEVTIEELISALPKSLQSTLQDRLRELGTLISLVSMRPNILLRPNLPKTHWQFHVKSDTAFAPIDELCCSDLDFCRGLTLHEAAHAMVTRIFDLLSPQQRAMRALTSLLNVIEDCRIETWLQLRQPGSIEWIRAYNQEIFGAMFCSPLSECLAPQFLLGILSRWWRGEDLEGTHPTALEALEEAWSSVEEAISAQPTRMQISHHMIQDVYAHNRTLRYTYSLEDLRSPPDDFERLVRVRQLQMLSITFTKVWPVYERLLQADQDEGRGEQLEKWLNQLHSSVPQHTQRRCQQVTGEPTSASPPGPKRSDQSQSQKKGLQKSIAKAFNPNARDAYLESWSRLSAEIDQLANELIRVFHARNRSSWLTGYPSGARLDIRGAMSFDADPREYDRLWERKSKPRRIDPYFIFCLDISGSMQGERIRAAFDGVVLLSEVCARLKIPFELVSFNTSAQLIHTADTPLGEAERLKIAQLLEAANGGTEFKEAFTACYARLERAPQRDRVMVFLSDGEDTDAEETMSVLRQIHDLNVQTVGLGLGPETTQLARFFDEGIYGVSASVMATRFARLLRSLLIQDL